MLALLFALAINCAFLRPSQENPEEEQPNEQGGFSFKTLGEFPA